MTTGHQAMQDVSWRALTGEDLPLVYELEAAGEAFDDGVIEVSLSDLQGEWARPDFDPASMSTGCFHGSRLVAYALVFQGRAEALVHPAYRGKGLGTELARWSWQVARFEGRDRVGQTISDNETSAAALFVSLGYERGHAAWILRRELTPVPVSTALPEDCEFRPYRPGEDDKEIYRLIDEAFAEWRNADSESMGFENWVACTLNSTEPTVVVSITTRGRLIGVALGHDYRESDEGWIDQIAVQREHRGRGLGRALLEECFRRFAEAGRASCGVSTDSRTGALGLYEYAGMRLVRCYTCWVKAGLQTGGTANW